MIQGSLSTDEVTLENEILVAANISPLPLLSITLWVEGDNALASPLQQAKWKRQLTGHIFLHDHILSTTIRLPLDKGTVNLTVDSLAAPKSTYGDSSSCFLVLPSTRITLKTKPVAAIPATIKKATSPSTSPVADLLMETIHCIQSGNTHVPRTFLLSGPPGVGKTHAVRLALERTSIPTELISLRGSELLQQHSNAATALQRQFQVASTKEKQVTLIFLDECDALVSVDSMAAMLALLLDQVANQWPRTIVVGATNRIDTLPGYLRRAGRFDREIPLGPPDTVERSRILMALLGSDQNASLQEQEIQRVAELCVGYVPADLTALVRRACFLASREGEMDTYAMTRAVSFLERAMADVGASALRDASLAAPPKITWSDIAGDPGGAKTLLRQAIEWPRTKAESFASLGLVPPRGILLHGPPGCAKTTLARAAAGASGVAFLTLSPAEVYASSYVGEAEAVVRRAFTLARSAAPCILFFDEMDAIFGGAQDGGRGSSAEARVLSTFLNEMDGVDNNQGKDGVLVLGATNRPWTLDSALVRPGRLGDKVIYIPPPDASSRLAILKMQFGNYKDFDFDHLASDALSGLMTGAELVGACQEAKLNLVRGVSQFSSLDESATLKQEHVEEALKAVKPLLADPGALQEFRLFEQSTTTR